MGKMRYGRKLFKEDKVIGFNKSFVFYLDYKISMQPL